MYSSFPLIQETIACCLSSVFGRQSDHWPEYLLTSLISANSSMILPAPGTTKMVPTSFATGTQLANNFAAFKTVEHSQESQSAFLSSAH